MMDNKHTNTNPRIRENRNISGKNRSQCGTELEIGRISVCRPRFGRIDIYMKADNNRGAIVICERDGIRCGVTPGVLNRFSEPGRHRGWAYLNRSATIVFKFALGEASKAPRGLFSIETSDGPVDFPAANRNSAPYTDGALVAFDSRLIRRAKMPQLKRQATDVFLLDSEHLPLIARLISDGRLRFPEHDELCELFLDSITSREELDRQCRQLFASALWYLASSSCVPTQFQSLARVERTKLSLKEDLTATAVRPQPNSPKRAKSQGTVNKGTTQRHSPKGAVVADVVRVNLQIEED